MAEFRALKAALLPVSDHPWKSTLLISTVLLTGLASLPYPNPANQSRKRSPMPVV